jgi:Ca-activated chloride channel homolog
MKAITAALLLIFIAGLAAQPSRAQSSTATMPPPPPMPQKHSNAAKPSAAKPAATAQAEGEEVGDGDVLRVTTNLVSIPVSVMDRDGRYIFDLRQEDFQIYEDGVEQQVAHFSSVEQPFTVVLLMDSSSSTISYLDQIRDAAAAFITQLRPRDSVLPITFDGTVRPLLFKGTSDRTFLNAALARMRSDEGNNGTRLYDAVDFSYQLLKRVRGRKAIILFTDGEDTWSRATIKSTLQDATELDALVYTIHYGERPLTDYLSSLSERTGGHFYQATDLETIKQAFVAVAEELRRQYSIGFYPTKSPRRGEERQLKIKVNRPGVGVRTRKSYVY